MNYDPKIIDDYIKSMDYYNFQDFCDRLLLTLFPNDYTPVRAGGRNGDMKNDGYCYASRTFFQAHATRGESAKQTKNKIEADLGGCIDNWNDVSKFVYITNDTLIGEVENFVDSLRSKYPNITIETWGDKKLTSEIRKLEIKEIEFVIDRRIIPEISFSESDVVSSKFLVTSEFDFIKEISGNDLSHFPFENPILFNNQILEFLRSLVGTQEYRHDVIEKSIDVKREDYLVKYPDAKTLPIKENEYQFYFHKRIPNREELKSATNEDGVSQFLINNDVSEEKISEILTGYEGLCAGSGTFEEHYQLRPLYAQFLIIKNISDFPIRLKNIESELHDGVLYESSLVDVKRITNLPEFIIEPGQNIIITVGVFLTNFQRLSTLNNTTITSTYIPEQIQKLELGSIKENQKVEFLGPRLVPRKICLEFKNQEFECGIHDFSFERVYWLDRQWLCGSCPHLFYIQNGILKYQGEILSTKPNQIQIDRFTIPSMVTELIIAELEQEVTCINYIKRNEMIIDTQILLIEGDVYSTTVSPEDRIEIEGKYELSCSSNKTLPTNDKYHLIENFKINYTQSVYQSSGTTINTER